MEKEDLIKVLDLRDNKDEYLRIVELQDFCRLSVIDRLYKKWEQAYRENIASLLSYASALQGQINADKHHKIDPYIAGGAANGAFGPVAGVSAGVSAQSRNLKIDEEREREKELVRDTTYQKASKEGSLLYLTESIYHILDQYPEAVKISEEYYKEKEREEAEKALQLEKQKKDTLKGIVILSLILALFVDLISGCMFISVEAAVSVFAIAWVISCITLYVMASKQA
jgi:hypothetical protein